MPSPGLTGWLIPAALAAGYGYHRAKSRGLFALWRVRRVAARKIGEAREGDVRLAGRVLSQGALLEAPFSRRACVFHDVLVEETVAGVGVRTIARALRGATFSLDDGTGTLDVVLDDPEEVVLVTGPRHVTSVVYRDVVTSSDLGLGPSDRLPLMWKEKGDSRMEAFLIEHGVDAAALSGRMRASEGIISVGDHISVVGRASLESAPGGESVGYRSPAAKYVIRPSMETPLTIIKARPRPRPMGSQADVNVGRPDASV